MLATTGRLSTQRKQPSPSRRRRQMDESVAFAGESAMPETVVIDGVTHIVVPQKAFVEIYQLREALATTRAALKDLLSDYVNCKFGLPVGHNYTEADNDRLTDYLHTLGIKLQAAVDR